MNCFLKLIKLLTDDTYKVTLEEKEEGRGNRFSRNSDCSSGGDQIMVKINNHPKQMITGVKIVLYPYIPDQDLGNEQTFDPIVKEETFDGEPSETEISVNPAFSYRISVSYSTKYGYLNPSKNVTSPGEFERMMDHHLGKVSFNLSLNSEQSL